MAALLNRKPAEALDVETVDIPDPRMDPRLRPVEELLTALTQKYLEMERSRKVELALEQLRTTTQPADSSHVRGLKAYLTSLGEPAAVRVPADAGAANDSRVILDAVAILKGAAAEPPPTHERRLAAIDRALVALGAGVNAQTEIRDTVLGELTLEFFRRLQPDWDRLQVEFFNAGRALARETWRIRVLRSRITAAGYVSRSDLLRTPNVRAPLALGSESDWSSEISGWKRILESWGLLR